MAMGQPASIDRVVCAPSTACPGGRRSHYSGPHTIVGGGGCAPPVDLVGDRDGASSDEDDEDPAEADTRDGPTSSASGSEGRHRDEEVSDSSAPQHGFPVRFGVLNMRGWARRRAEVVATMRWQRHDILDVTETHSCGQGWQFAPLYTTLELGAVNIEGKDVLLWTEAGLTLRPQWATDTDFVVVVQSGDVDRWRLVLVCARPGAAGLALYRRWTDMVMASTLPVVIMGKLNKDAL